MKLYRVRPAQRLLLLTLCLVLVACAVAIAEGIWPELDGRLSSLGGMLLALFVTLAVLDLVQARRLPPISLERLLPGSLALGQWHQARLRIQHRLTRAAAVEVFDHCPAACEAEGLPLRVELQPGKTAEIRYRLRPLTRGLAVFPGVELRIGSTFGLWDLQFYEPAQTDTRIYPNFAALARYDLLAADPNTRIGIRRGPRRGTGTEFHQLREYQTGDVLRQVDWKATSRRLQLISREYQTERDQQLVLMLDGGRRLRARDGDLSHFDQALNASLMLAYVALRQGDAVGMMSFGRDTRWVPAVKGAANLHRLLNGFYDLHAGAFASDYLAAAQQLMERQRKRALIVLVTDLRDEDCEDVLLGIRLLRRRHLVLVANLRERALDQVLQAPVEEFDAALRYCGTVSYLEQRRKMQERLQAESVMVLDCGPNELQSQVINRYLQVKRAGLL